MADSAKGRFPSPFEVATPPGCEGWERMYPYYMLFSEGRREFEEGKFWLCDLLHHPEPFYPFDTLWYEYWWMSLSQFNSRVFIVPPALGIDDRILNGYAYISANAIMDPEVVGARVAHFMERAGYYYQNWDKLYANWEQKMSGLLKELEAVEFKRLPEMVDLADVTGAKGQTEAFDIIDTYDRLINLGLKAWQYHFEFLNLGYAAYLTFMDFCKKAFPDIGDQTVSRMVSGVDVILFKPDEEIKRLARLAVDLDVASAFKGSRKPEQTLAELGQSSNGRKWLEEFEKAKDPWFYLSSGTGFYHHHTAWINDLSIPFTALLGYVEKLERGESLERPLNALRQERDRLATEYRELLPTEQDKGTFDQLLQTARTVFPYVENHLFYVEHWFHTVFYGKIRDLAKVFVEHKFFEDTEDIFYLHRNEVREAIYDMAAAWAVGTPARGPSYWPPEIAKRKEILKKLREWAPPPALGVAPEVVTEPFTIMLWGVTSERVQDWLAPKEDPDSITELRGFAGSPGIAEGPARVIRTVEEIKDIQPGEILICPITSPSWAPVFTRIKAAVTDVGGIMSHAAIVCREYGLPAIAGTAFGTKVIKTGQMVRVDGNNGVVTILR